MSEQQKKQSPHWRTHLSRIPTNDFPGPVLPLSNNSPSFVPASVRLKDLGQLVALEFEKAKSVAKELNSRRPRTSREKAGEGCRRLG